MPAFVSFNAILLSPTPPLVDEPADATDKVFPWLSLLIFSSTNFNSSNFELAENVLAAAPEFKLYCTSRQIIKRTKFRSSQVNSQYYEI